METVTNKKPEKPITIHNFLYHETPTSSTWTVCDGGWRVALFYIDHEDLWSGWFPKQHMDVMVLSYSYDKETNTGYIYYE